MKRKRLQALLLAAVLTFSMVTSSMPAYAEPSVQDDGFCAHHTVHTPECGYQEATEGSLCNHTCTQESGCITVTCVHEHDDTCGYVEGVEGSCSHICSEETGCVAVDCVHTEHDDSCGYREPTPAQPCRFLCAICDCTCTAHCAEGAVNANCPVCAKNWQDCSFTSVDVNLSFDADYAQCGQTGVPLTLTASINGKKLTGATVRISLSEQEAGMISIPQDTPGLALENNQLVLTLTDDAGTGSAAFSANLSVATDTPVVLDIAKEDISVSLVPEEYQTSPLISVSVMGDSVTFVEKLPTEDEYGSNMAYDVSVEDVTVRYVDQEGKAVARQESAPAFTLYYQVGDAAPVALSGDSLPFGLTQIPQITTSSKEDSWTGSMTDTAQLPSAVLALDADGNYVVKTVSWYLAPSYPEDYYPNAGCLVEITDENAGQYPTGLGRGWYFISGQEPFPDDKVTIKDYLGNLSHNVYWADNGNADGKRPQSLDGFYELQFAFDGSSSYQTLNSENMAELGLNSIPQPSLVRQSGIWKFSWKESLPSKVTYTDSTGSGSSVTRDVNWRVVFKEDLNNYAMVEITPENAGDYSSVKNQYGTYYILETSLTFTARIYRGKTTQGEALRQAFLEQFYLNAAYTGNQHQYFQLAEVKEDGHIINDVDDNPDIITITVTNLWRYNLDNTRINYSIQEDVSSADGKLNDVSGLDEGDYFAISYDNSAVPSFSDITDAVYSGGTLKLALSGTIDYDATKVWLDNNAQERPQALMELWRYRSGEPYSTASLVRNEAGEPYMLDLADVEPNADGSYPIVFAGLPKYDPEGYRYRYVVREYLDGDTTGRYEQVLGKVLPDGTIEDPESDVRDPNDTFLYNGGTLSNRLRGTVPVTVTKDWKAASFQSEFEDVMVEMRLQSRYKDSQLAWEDTEYTYQMFGFLAENLTVTHTGSYPQYDEQGRELEYRWVEESVYQGGEVIDGSYVGGTKVDSSISSDGTRTFTLDQNGCQIIYSSTVDQSQADNYTVITNSIANVIEYDVVKGFEPEWNPEQYQDSYTFGLFRSTSGSDLIRYATFTINRNEETGESVITKEDGIDHAKLTIEQTGEWSIKISGLPEFDAEGQQYEYLLLEENGNMLYLDTQRDEEGNYSSIIYNGPGENNVILVRKEWIDESDSQHRLPVEITVFDKNTREEITKVTLGTDTWYAMVGIGQHAYEDVFLLETKVGDTVVDNDTDHDGIVDPPVYTGDPNEDPTAVRYNTQYHNYEVTYTYDENFGSVNSGEDTFEGVHCFTVTNRRLGNINLTVTKNWVDGDGTARQELQQALDDAGLHLAVRLEFMTAASIGLEEVYEITRDGYPDDQKGDVVTISQKNPTKIEDNDGNWVDSIQPLDLSLNEQKLYFWNLPKYDSNGASVRYTVQEVFVDQEGKTVTQAELSKNYKAVAEAYQDYRLSTTVGDYVVGANHALDTQDFTLTNKLSATTAVSWYTLWLDDFAYVSGNRPDIYLNIYARTHVKGEDGNVTTQTEICVRNYRWEYQDDEGETGISERNFWKCNIENLPKYDELGYEIDYFAVMNSTVITSDFDYVDTAYAPDRATDGDEVFGNSDGLQGDQGEANRDRVENVSDDAQNPSFALKAGNTFVNSIYDVITYSGEKLWTNLPDDYPLVDLPTVVFTLDRSIAGGETETEIATMTIHGSDWEDLNVSGHYVFEFSHTGNNAPANGIEEVELPDGETYLPRFDSNGRLYTYTLHEQIDWTGTDAGAGQSGESIFGTAGTGQTLINSYSKGDAALAAVKHLTVEKGSGSTVYPAITLTLNRTYKTNADEVSESEWVETVVWSADEVKAAVDAATDDDGDGKVTVSHTFGFDDLEIYAPNGSRYNYTIVEDKTELGGYLTWAAAGSLSAAELAAEDAYRNKSSVSRLAAHTGGGIDASFLNRQQDPQEIQLSGTKKWNDLQNAFGFRPENPEYGLTVKLERMANAQSGQNNRIDWHEVDIDGTEVGITWSDDPRNPDQWIYTITGLERYANTGMPWIYRITETVPEHYLGTTITAQQKKTDSDGNIEMNSLTNSILTSTWFKKTWVDSNGATITENLLGEDIELKVSYALQLRAQAEDSASWSRWEDAGEYFKRELAADDQSGLKDRIYTGAIGGALGDAVWSASHRGTGNSFSNLPLQIRAGDRNVYQLEYRVVETSVSVYRKGNDTPLLTQTYLAPVDNDSGEYSYRVSPNSGGLFSPFYGNGKTTQANATNIHRNQMQTTQLTVQKVWANDNNEVYVTRPESSVSRYNWEVTLLVERSTDGVKWEPIPVDSEITLYGTNADNDARRTISGLPVYVFDDTGSLKTCQYRVRELQCTGADAGLPLKEGSIFGNGYLVSYSGDGLTVTNTLQTTQFSAVKKWNDEAQTHPSITVELRYLKEGGNKENKADYLPFEPAAKVTLNGEPAKDQTKLYYAQGAWTAVWKEVPLILANSGLENGHTVYRIFETVSGNYITDTEITGNETTITNTPSIAPRVTKYWLGVSPAQSVTVELRRKTETTQPQTVAQVQLNATNNWTYVFDPQPLYDPSGNAYTYSVAEVSIGGKDAETAAQEGGFDISYGGNMTSGFQIYNHELDTIYVIKDWADAANPDGRPLNLELTLERTTVSNPGKDDWEPVENVTYTWQRSGNTWTTSFADLPMYETGSRLPYTYRVTETVPDGYEGTVLSDDNLTFHFRNTLSEEIDIPVQKVWVDNDDHFGYRPDSITVELYRNGVATGKTLTLAPNALQNFWNQITGTTFGWSGVFENLPKYDENGAVIDYTVVERDGSEHYDVSYGKDEDGTLVVTNTAHGSLTVSKKVTGTGADPEKLFHFVVELDDDTITGLYGEMEFFEGKASFTLHDGQSITASDLPAGIGYTVSEKEAGKGAYTTTSTGEEGTIIAGTAAQAAFTNHRSSVSVEVTKSWQDENNKDGIRPASVTVRLLADGTDTGKTLVLKEESGWKGSFTDLDKYKNGAEIVYTVEEIEVEGYTAKISGSAAEGFTITNSHTPNPPANIPQTGDNSNLPLWLALGALSLVGLVCCVVFFRKKKSGLDK